MTRRVYLPGGEQAWLHAPPPLWRKRLRQRYGRIVFNVWCCGYLVAIGLALGRLI